MEPGTIFPLHPEAKEEWEQWAPTLWVGAPSGSEVEHAIRAETHGHLRKRRVESEAVAPPIPEEASTPAVAAPPPEAEPQEKSKPGFFRRIFGRD